MYLLLSTLKLYLYTLLPDSSTLHYLGPSFSQLFFLQLRGQRGSEGLKHLREGQIQPFNFSQAN